MIRGPMAGKYFMNGTLLHPQTETMARIHGIRNITPSAITTCGVLVRYSHSYQFLYISDACLGPLGAVRRRDSPGSWLKHRHSLFQQLPGVPYNPGDWFATEEEERC